MDKTARSLQLGRVQTALLIQFPATAPYLFTGMKLALGYAIAGVIGSEFILSGAGIGPERNNRVALFIGGVKKVAAEVEADETRAAPLSRLPAD